MADTLWFSNDYHDMSVQWGNDAGFQFEFYCQRCHDTWRNKFEPYKAARAAGWIRRASNMAQGAASSVGLDVAEGIDGMVQNGWHKARDASFAKAIEAAAEHFHRCARCTNYVCDQCFNVDRGLCLNCAPDLASEVESARAHGLVDQATWNAREVGAAQAAEVDVVTEKQLVCTQCGTETHGAKFCPECGHRQQAVGTCSGCQSVVPTGSRFCPECGQAQ